MGWAFSSSFSVALMFGLPSFEASGSFDGRRPIFGRMSFAVATALRVNLSTISARSPVRMSFSGSR